jgi:hypothetical protein
MKSWRQHLPIADYRIKDKKYGVCNTGWHYVSSGLKTNNPETDRGLIGWMLILPPLAYDVKVYFSPIRGEDMKFETSDPVNIANIEKEARHWEHRLRNSVSSMPQFTDRHMKRPLLGFGRTTSCSYADVMRLIG